jgi:hypothetical protein
VTSRRGPGSDERRGVHQGPIVPRLPAIAHQRHPDAAGYPRFIEHEFRRYVQSIVMLSPPEFCARAAVDPTKRLRIILCCGSRKLERPVILIVAASAPQTPPLSAPAPWNTHLGATRDNTSDPTRRSRIRPRPLPVPALPTGRDPCSQASTRGLPAGLCSAEAAARGPDPLDLALPSLVRLARGPGDRQTRDGHRLEAPEVPRVLDEAKQV